MRILFLSTWFPYPLNQGSKIRAHYLLRSLAQQHEVALVSFEDGALQPEWLEYMKQYCARIDTLPRPPFAARREKVWLGWFSRQPSSVVSIYSPHMAELVGKVASQWRPDCVVALTFVTAPYALQIPNIPKVLDVDNFMARMLYEAYRAERGSKARLRRWLAYKKFEHYEKQVYSAFDLSLIVTPADQQALIDQLDLQAERIGIVPNGVDTSAYPVGVHAPLENSLVFNGALTYNANFDAMKFFLSEIFPRVIREIPEVNLSITGITEGVPLDRLLVDNHVNFTGYLDDIQCLVASSWACVVPLRIGGGTRLKILEAMALGTPVVSTSKGAEGLDVLHGVHALIADDPGEFAAHLVRLLREPRLRELLAQNALRLVKEKYEWSDIGRDFCCLLDRTVSASHASGC